MAKNYKGIPRKICFESEKYMREHCCDLTKIAVLGLNLPKKKERQILDLISKAYKQRMKKLGF